MIDMQNYTPVMQSPFFNMAVDAVRTALPTIHTQINQARLNTLQVRQAAIKAMDQSIKASLDADKQFFELVQAMVPIAHKQAIRTRLSLLEIHEAWLAALNQSMEQSLKTDQQLYDACLELLNKDIQQEAAAEGAEAEVTHADMETEVEIEVVPDDETVAEETTK